MLTRSQAEQLRDRLLKELSARAKRVGELECYRDGRHPLPEGLTQARGRKAQEMRKLFERLLKESRSNWCGLIVDAVDERLAVDGFRFGGQQQAAEDVWEIWQANQMDAESLLVQGSALSTGQAFVTVWPGRSPGDYPTITPEHPSEVIVAYQAGTRSQRRAALKSWTDDDGFRNVTLYEPGFLWKWQSSKRLTGFAGQFHAGELSWEPRQPADEQWPLPNVLGVVPVVEFAANPRLRPAPFGGGVAEFEGVIDIQDRLNETVFGRLLATHFSAYRQKWATGLEIPTDEEGRPIEPFDSAITKVWAASSTETKFGEFSEADLNNYLGAADADIQHMAAISRTPPHYLLGKMVNISGDALKAAETGLVSKCSRHKRFFGEAHEEVARLAIRAWKPDDVRAMDVRAEVIWRDTESRSEAERVDALVKLVSLGVPQEVLWARIPGVTQEEIRRWKDMAPVDTSSGPATGPQPTPEAATATA